MLEAATIQAKREGGIYMSNILKMDEEAKIVITGFIIIVLWMAFLVGTGFLISYWMDLHQVNHCKRQIENNMRLDYSCIPEF